MTNKHIWIYDDDALIESDLQLVLQLEGHQVSFKSKEEIVDSLHKEDSHDKADLVICNPTPFISLDETYRPQCPILLISSHLPKYINPINRHIEFQILHKPFLPFQLKQMVDNL